MITRRNFLGGMIAACAAPAIVRAESLMRIWVPSEGIIHPNVIKWSQEPCNQHIFIGYSESPIISALPDIKTLDQMINEKLRHDAAQSAGKRMAKVADDEMYRILSSRL